MVTHTWNSCSAINPSKVHTHPEKWAAIYDAVPGEHLGVRCLAQEHLSHGIEGEEEHWTLTPPPTFPAGPRLIRPRLPFLTVSNTNY